VAAHPSRQALRAFLRMRRFRRAKSRRARSEPLAVVVFTMSNSAVLFVPAARCCARVGLDPFAPDPKRGGRSADRRTISFVALVRRDWSAPSGMRRVP
jgi:hypothetical protein